MKIKVEFDKEMFGIRAKVSLTSKAGEPKEDHVLTGIDFPLSKKDARSVQRLFTSTQEALKWTETVVSQIQIFIKSMREELPPPWVIEF